MWYKYTCYTLDKVLCWQIKKKIHKVNISVNIKVFFYNCWYNVTHTGQKNQEKQYTRYYKKDNFLNIHGWVMYNVESETTIWCRTAWNVWEYQSTSSLRSFNGPWTNITQWKIHLKIALANCTYTEMLAQTRKRKY